MANKFEFWTLLEEMGTNLLIFHIDLPEIILVAVVEAGDFLLFRSFHHNFVMRMKATISGLVSQSELDMWVKNGVWTLEFDDPVIISITDTLFSEPRNFLLTGLWGRNLVRVEILFSDIVGENDDITCMDGSSSLTSDDPPVVIIVLVVASDFLLFGRIETNVKEAV